MAKPKPNFKSNNNKTSGDKSKTKKKSDAKRQTTKTHHDTLKGNKGNGGGKLS